ncbi:PQQ-dependent sugar dehydrogenase [Nonlabens ponticola]|uniref:Sorbosone dehydrogenase family protein n=1 Tax=Nonlabens ponticola TaxID=2496866 RepID=A0A3S9MXX7_9FLAO|nr:sorbosone dehydrogenase family protein [Nonlabens ponticola]AZQ43989.1 sorbosone dehydrogenase family protein [Nonlabens ponticola]
MKKILLLSLALAAFTSCKTKNATDNTPEVFKENLGDNDNAIVETSIGDLELPPPYHSESEVLVSNVVGWKDGNKPIAPAGFQVNAFATDLKHPRWTYVHENNDIFVVESNTRNSANQISLLRDSNGDGTADYREVFLSGLNQPFGMLIIDDYFYVANTDGLYRYAYKTGQEKLTGAGEKILDLPAGGYNNHWTRNLITNADQSKIYISVGSGSNVGENGMEYEVRRATILEINPDGSGEIEYATGLRNPVGMDWNPITGELWTAVNERDKLGNNLVPDYATSVKKGGWYGWPYSYYGEINDPRWRNDPHQELVDIAIVPDVPLGSHTASLGFEFYTADQFPATYKNGAFIGQHGSWNRKPLSGYKVVFIPFDAAGNPQPPQDFLTGFTDPDSEKDVYGRPVGVTVHNDGSLLVNDDDSGIVWRVSAK